MEWIFAAFLAVSLVHMAEEYLWPGGFMQMMKRLNPRFAPLVTSRMAMVINGLQLVLCALAMLVGDRVPLFSMSVAGLLFINGWVHFCTAMRLRGYAPGVVSGSLLYIPLAAFAYSVFVSSGLLTLPQVLITGLLGLLYQAVPITYLAAATALKHSSQTA